jgi:hypothetical protein
MAEQNEVNIEEIRSKLDDINKLISPYKLAYVSPIEDCVPLEKNAHFFEKDKLDKLVQNVAHDGFLSQLPFGMKRKSDDKYLILSGNHRLKAAIKANLTYILILYIDEVDRDTQIAYQLSHNSLVGKDDLQMLKDIYKEMKSIEAKEFSGLNGIQFVDVEKLQVSSINDGDIELTEIKFLFIENRKNDVKAVLSELEKHKLNEDSSIVFGSFDAFVKVLTEVKKAYGIKSMTVAFGRMIDICNEQIKAVKN